MALPDTKKSYKWNWTLMGLSSKERVKLCDGSEISPGDDVLVLWQDSSKRTAWRRARLIRVCQGASAFLGVYELSDGKRIIRTRYSVKRKPKRRAQR